jgi:two-component system osmolarity sensor histidine kinase EnvZ
MSVPDEQARTDMVADIEQANAIIGQFMDYARSSDSSAALATAPTTALLPVLHQAASGYQHLNDVVLTVAWTTDTADSAGTADPIPTSPHTHEPSTALLSCRADPVDVLRWVNNLLENARRYGQSPPTPPPSTLPRCAHVHLRAWVQGPYCAVQVADNGPGVDADTLTHLTRPFFRADTARSQSVGAGLGLAVVEKMLTRIGGRLELQSPGPLADLPEHRGLCATLWLPREIMK